MFYFLKAEVDSEVEGGSVVEEDSVVGALEVDLAPEVPMKMMILPGYCRQFTRCF